MALRFAFLALRLVAFLALRLVAFLALRFVVFLAAFFFVAFRFGAAFFDFFADLRFAALRFFGAGTQPPAPSSTSCQPTSFSPV